MTSKHNENQVSYLYKILEAASTRFDEAEVFNLQTKTLSVEHRNGQLKETSETESNGYCLRVIKNKQIAQVSTSNPEKVQELIREAKELIPFGETIRFSFPHASTVPELSTYPIPENRLTQMIDLGQGFMKKMLSYDKQVTVSSGSSLEITRVHLVNTLGFDQTYTRHICSSSAVGVLAEEGNILTAFKYHLGHDFPSDFNMFSDYILNIFNIAKNNVPLKSGSLKILFSPFAVSDLMSAFAQGISGTSIVKGTSPLVDKIGYPLMDKRISIIDNPVAEDAPGSVPFDDEGIPSSSKYLVKNGVLNHYLLNLKTASHLNRPSSGNGFRRTTLINSRSYVDSPSPSYTNLIIPSGDRSVQDILNSCNQLLYIHQLSGVLLGNLINGDWSGNIALGILYENGTPIGRIKNAMTGGNIYHMLKNTFIESSLEREWINGFGSGGGFRLLPHMLFDDVNVSV